MIVPARERYMLNEYSSFSDTRLLKEIEALRSRIEAAGETVFMRMLHELQVYQMELELQNRELREARNELLETRERFVDLYDFAPLPYFTFDVQGTILELNLSGAEMLGKDRLSLIGRSFVEYIAKYDREEFLAYVQRCIGGNMDSNAVFALELPSGKAFRLKTARVVSQLSSGNVDACRIAFEIERANQTPGLPAEAPLSDNALLPDLPGAGMQQDSQQAYYDDMTGLASRGLLYDRLQQALLQAKRGNSLMAVMFLDLAADEPAKLHAGKRDGVRMVKEAAQRLSYCLREGDTLSRLNGDEFVAVVRNISDTRVPAQIATRMVKALEKPFALDDGELKVTASVGISVSPNDGNEVTELLKNADIAMSRARQTGKNNFLYYETGMNRAQNISI